MQLATITSTGIANRLNDSCAGWAGMEYAGEDMIVDFKRESRGTDEERGTGDFER